MFQVSGEPVYSGAMHLEVMYFKINSIAVLTTACGKPATKSLKACLICSFVFVVLKSLLDFPSLFLMPSIRNPRVAVDDIVSLHTMYL